MKRHVMMFCLLFSFGLFTQVSITLAVSRTYIWHIEGGYSTYDIYIVTEDHWKTDTAVDVVVRLTLTDKHWTLDHTKTNWMQIIIKSSKFIIDSGRREEEVTLTNEADYWQKTISMQIPSSKLQEGENVTMSIAYTINIDEFDAVQHKWWNHVSSSNDNPIHADVTRPTFWETMAGILFLGIGLAVIVIGGISGFIIYRRFYRRTVSVKPPSPPAQ
jgi:hypothetical protein